jgi:hypothetical protein
MDMTGSMRKKSLRPQIERFTLCENDTPQIEQYTSMRTICPGEGCWEHPKKQKCRCGNGSVAAAFFWPDSEKALKSRAFGQNEKVGNSIKITYLLWPDCPKSERKRQEYGIIETEGGGNGEIQGKERSLTDQLSAGLRGGLH